MPNGHTRKEYGGHEYPDSGGTVKCKYGCGCWMGDSRSGGPLGLDPFGKCPNNPLDGVMLGGQTDYTDVVEMRIEDLENRAFSAEAQLAKVAPSKTALAAKITDLNKQLRKANGIISRLRTILAADTEDRT